MLYENEGLKELFDAVQQGKGRSRREARRALYEVMSPLQRLIELASLSEQINEWSEDMGYTLDWSLAEETRANLLEARRDLTCVMIQKGEKSCIRTAHAAAQFMPVI